jgi:hypothetical protein
MTHAKSDVGIPEHVIYYLVEADSLDAIHQFLDPGFKRCTSKITPVGEELIVR